VHFENGIARCSFQTAFDEGHLSWPKPISCHLFPVRVRDAGLPYVRYEQIEECRAGRETGQRLGLPLRDFLKDALVRKYGETWYEEFLNYCEYERHREPSHGV
jgi:hypothetical protein